MGFALATAILFSAAAHGQVMEIGSNGAVKTYTGPTVYTSRGAIPIGASPPRRQCAPSGSASVHDVYDAAVRTGLGMDLIAAVAWRESHSRNDAVSRRGALGEMQLMPDTARTLGIDPTDAAQNIRGGAAYLRVLMRRYDGDLVRSLAAYNAGPAAVDRYGGVPPYKETRAYVDAVLDRLSQVVVPVAGPATARR